jgi:hypothetical protein
MPGSPYDPSTATPSGVMFPTQDSDGPIGAANSISYLQWLYENGPDPKDVDSTSAAYDAMAPVWSKISTVMAGTETMRAARERFLPKHQYENGDKYRERLKRGVLDNYSLRTLEQLVGKAFKDPPALSAKAPTELVDFLSDVDGLGNDWLVTSRAWLLGGVKKAFCHMWVDFSQAAPRVDGAARTLKDDQDDGLRPYWRVVQPEDVIFMMGATVNGQFNYTHIRISECTFESDGAWGEKLVERIRVLEPGTWALYKKVPARNAKKYKWILEDAGAYGLHEIPWVTYYTDNQGLAEGKPPLEDLVDLNIEHYQSASDQRAILTVARFPMLAVSGAKAATEDDEPLVIGPNKFLSVEDPQGKFYYVEHTGKAIGDGAHDIAHIEERMVTYGAQFMRKQADRASAAGRQLDSAEALSLLQCWCYDFRDALDRVIAWTAQWMGLTLPHDERMVIFELAPDANPTDQFELATLTAARARFDISREAFLTELKRRGLLPDTYDVEGDGQLIKDEGPTLGMLFDMQTGGEFPSNMAGATGPGSTGLPGTPGAKPNDSAASKGSKGSAFQNKKD